MYKDEEVPIPSEVYLCWMFQCEEVPPQVLWLLRGWQVLYAPADQDCQDPVPL